MKKSFNFLLFSFAMPEKSKQKYLYAMKFLIFFLYAIKFTKILVLISLQYNKNITNRKMMGYKSKILIVNCCTSLCYFLYKNRTLLRSSPHHGLWAKLCGNEPAIKLQQEIDHKFPSFGFLLDPILKLDAAQFLNSSSKNSRSWMSIS